MLLAAIAATTPVAEIAVYFSPHGGCTDAIVRELAAAKESVLVQAYEFTSMPIARALADAEKRGVQVQVIFDKSVKIEKSSATRILSARGHPDLH